MVSTVTLAFSFGLNCHTNKDSIIVYVHSNDRVHSLSLSLSPQTHALTGFSGSFSFTLLVNTRLIFFMCREWHAPTHSQTLSVHLSLTHALTHTHAPSHQNGRLCGRFKALKNR